MSNQQSPSYGDQAQAWEFAPALAGGTESGYRLVVGEPVLEVRDVKSGARMQVMRLSPVHVVFKPAKVKQYRVGQNLGLELSHANLELGPITGRVTRVRPGAKGAEAEIMVEFVNFEQQTGREILTLLWGLVHRGLAVPTCWRPERVETLRDPERIRSLLSALFAKHARAVVRVHPAGKAGGVVPGTVVRAARLNPDFSILVQWSSQRPFPTPPFEVEISGFYSDFCFQVTSGDINETTLLPTPNELYRIYRRRHRRVPAPPGVSVSFDHPVWPEIHVERLVREISLDGLSIATQPEMDLLYPGLEIGNLNVSWKGGSKLQIAGTVRHLSSGIHGKGETCGLRVLPRDRETSMEWEQEVSRLLYPNTQIGGVWCDDLWDLYDKSGYFELSDKTVADFEPLRQAFEISSRKLSIAPSLGIQVAWLTSDRAEASMSMLKAWEHAWIIYQLARYRQERPLWLAGSQTLLDLYLHGFEHVQNDPELRWHVVYVQENAYFSRAVHTEFPRRFADNQRACVLPFRALEGLCNDDRPPLSLKSQEVADATPEELEGLLKVIRDTRPMPYVEANDLVPDRFELPLIRKAWAAAGLRRDRHVLVARKDGTAVAAAILDLAEEGLHLFGLLDVVRLFALRDDGRTQFKTLLKHARHWYRQEGKQKFIYFEETGDHAHAVELGMTDLGAANITIMTSDLVPDLLEHVFAVTAPKRIPTDEDGE